MEVIGVASGRPPTVNRSQGSSTVFLTFVGTRDAKVQDRDTRIRIALADVQAARLWRLLGEQLSDAERLATELIGLVGTYLTESSGVAH